MKKKLLIALVIVAIIVFFIQIFAGTLLYLLVFPFLFILSLVLKLFKIKIKDTLIVGFFVIIGLAIFSSFFEPAEVELHINKECNSSLHYEGALEVFGPLFLF